MDSPSAKALGDELERLMREQIESLTKQTFLGINPEDLSREKQRLERIREVSADYLAALKKLHP
jgi:hypothetical protein